MDVILFFMIVGAGLALIPANIAKNKGYSFGLWWFYGWVLWILAIIHVALIPNKNAQPRQMYVVPSGSNSQNAAGELKEYKELLDQGIITQEEFDTKKKQILGL